MTASDELCNIVELLRAEDGRSENRRKTIGLFNGKFSKPFFLYYYSLYDSTVEPFADEAFDEWINSFDEYTSFSYCNGWVGVGVAMYLPVVNYRAFSPVI